MSKRKIRADFRKNRNVRKRESDLTRRFEADETDQQLDEPHQERISGKGELTRRRTVVVSHGEQDEAGFAVSPEIDLSVCRPGRVLSVHGLLSIVETAEGRLFNCTTRRLLRTLSTELRHVVAAGDRVLFRPADPISTGALPDDTAPLPDGTIERIEPRKSVLSRMVKNRQHVMVANVDQMVIVASAAQPRLKPGLIDRLVITAEKAKLRAVVCINKIDLAQAADLQPLIGVFSRMGYSVHLISAVRGNGMERLRGDLTGRASVVVGQSGVGKTSVLNAIEPGLGLRVAPVSTENQKGKHTTTVARLFRLGNGGYVVDTPGVRQFQLWDVIPAEVGGYFRDLRPFYNRCKFPNCTHWHEAECAVKDAVADGWLDARRYESYCLLYEDGGEELTDWK